MITSKKFLKQKKISHAFFNRIGGKSKGLYKSLNCGPGSKDVTKKVNKNLKIVKDKISKKSKNIFLMHQIHSNKVIFIDKHFKFNRKNKTADAVIGRSNDPVRIYRLIYDSLYDFVDDSTIPHAVVCLADYSYKSAFVADQEINLLACLTELMAQCKFK